MTIVPPIRSSANASAELGFFPLAISRSMASTS
jgi:hypothetical protein